MQYIRTIFSPNTQSIFVYAGEKLTTNVFLISLLIFITPFTNGENLFFNFNHTLVSGIVTLLLFFFNFDKIYFHSGNLNKSFVVLIFLLVLSYFLSMIFGLQYSESVFMSRYDNSFDASIKSLLYTIPLHLMIVYLIYVSIDDLIELRYLLLSFILSSFLVNLITLFLLSSGINTIAGRVASTFEDPNYLGRMEVISISLSFCFILFRSLIPFLKSILIINILFSLIIQILTFSRSSIITLVFSVVLILFFSKNRKLKLILTSVLILGMLIVIPFMSSVRYGLGESGGISFLSTFVDPSNALRLLLNLIALKMFIENPIFGVGFNNFYNTLLNDPNYFPIGLPLITNTTIIHSWFFAILAEQGLFGLLSFLSLIYLTCRNLLISIKENISEEVRMLGISLLVLFSVLVFNGLFFPTILLELIFTICCGMIAAFFKITKREYSHLYSSISGKL